MAALIRQLLPTHSRKKRGDGWGTRHFGSNMGPGHPHLDGIAGTSRGRLAKLKWRG